MKIHLHKNATTTPAQRAYIQKNSHLSVATLAEKTGVSKTTIRRWQKRMDVYDRPHTPKHIKTALSPIDELKIIICRIAFRAGLDDLHQIAKSFFKVSSSRASLNRCLKRYQISRMPKLGKSVPFDLKDYTGTYFYYNCFHMPSFLKDQPPVVLQTLLDCTFRTFHAQFSTRINTFICDHIQSFPLNVLGIIYNDPIMLGAESIDMQASQEDIKQLCTTLNVSSFHMDDVHSDTINKLNSMVEKLVSKPDTPKDTTQWETNAELTKQIFIYNFELVLGVLKQKTPYQAMESHYTRFPNSFKHKPEGSPQN